MSRFVTDCRYFLLLAALGLIACTNAVRSPVLLDSSDGSIRSLEDYVKPRPGRVVKIFLVHGMTHSDANWADPLIQVFAQRLHIDVPRCDQAFLAPTLDAQGIYLSWAASPLPGVAPATLCVVTNATSAKDVTYEFFALGWSPLTDPYKCLAPLESDRDEGHPIKTAFPKPGNLCPDERHYPVRRAYVNGVAIKDVVLDDGFPDVVLYLAPKVRPYFRAAVAQALCVMYAYRPPPSVPPIPSPASPRAYELCDDATVLESDRFVFISHSLGSNILLDTLCWLSECVAESPPAGAFATDEERRRLPRRVKPLIDKSLALGSPFYMFANQNVLLSLFDADPATNFGSGGSPSALFDIRRHPFFMSVPTIAEGLPLKQVDVIAFSDPNDDLSFIMHSEQLPSTTAPSAGTPVPVTVKNVLVTNAAEFLFLFENPLAAHVNYYRDPEMSRVIDVIVCGMKDGAVVNC